PAGKRNPMRIAFYAPMKPPSASVPSGDRMMARQIIGALEMAGHKVELASIFRSRDGAGDEQRQARLARVGARMADRLIRRYRAAPNDNRPDAWFTYHLYHKAPDWLGPRVADALHIPYVIAEASFAPKQEGGKWALGHEAAGAAIRRADRVISLNSHDTACVRPLLRDPMRLEALRPFTDVAPFAAAYKGREKHRESLMREFGLDPATPILLTVAMMRDGDKLDSYRVLGRALALLRDAPWQLVVVGDGDKRDEVERALRPAGRENIRFAGVQSPSALYRFYGGSDMMVWPAIKEAYGMALLEAQAAGLPVVAGNVGGVPDIVRNGQTGILTPEGDAATFAQELKALIDAPGRRETFGVEARRITAEQHSITAAAKRLDDMIMTVTGETAS
ncbi:MAG: glycosyltransferase family 4 protein, partial [Alphaproteobacteria bacterium]